MTDERDSRLFASLVYLADTLVTDFDAIDVADRLISASLDMLEVSAAGIVLDDLQGRLRVLASSSEEMRLLELLEVETREGPCFDAFSTGERELAPDLMTQAERWPTFVHSALAQGFVAAYAIPLRLRDRTIGALNLFAGDTTPLDTRQLQTAGVLASIATIGLINHRIFRRQELLAEQLQTALDSRVVIEQAKGVMAERSGLDMASAFELLRRAARARRESLSDVAQRVVAGELDATLLSETEFRRGRQQPRG